MSNPASIRSNDEKVVMEERKPLNSMNDTNDEEALKSEIKIPNQVNFGRPRKHPYKPGKYKCDYCDVMCSKPSVLKKHLRAHTNERPYPCSICKRSFKTKSNLSKHMKSKSHSSNSQKFPTNKEKVSMMLQALSGIDQDHSKSIDGSINNIEYDCIEKSTGVESSPTTSYDDRSVASEDNSAEDSLKKDLLPENGQVKKGDEIENELSSCSGMLTINSQRGPITVEVEIKLETMKQLQQGLSHMTMKKYSPSSPVTSIISRNDADVRAAESIVQMANQRRLEGSVLSVEEYSSIVNYENKLVTPKEEQRKNESTESQEQLTNENSKCQSLIYVPQKSTKSSAISYHPKAMVRNRSSNKNIPNEAQKKLKNCLLESLLKKMQKKNEKGSKHTDHLNRNGDSNSFNKNSATELATEFLPNSPNSLSQNNIPQKKIFNICSNSNSFTLNTLISDSKSPSSLLSFNPGKQAVIIKRAMPSNSQSSNSTSSLSSSAAILLLPPYSDSLTNPQRIHSPISVASFKVDTATDVLSKVFNNTKSLYQRHSPIVMTQASIPISSSHVKALHINNIKEELTIQEREIQESNDNTESMDESDSQSNNQHTSIHTSHESDPDSSPRLCIVEDNLNDITSENRKNIESDEEIDVVNTDSDDNDSTVMKLSEKGGSICVNKKRKGHVECDVDLIDCDSKKLKEMDKSVTLHAPNINAENLVQDCPLNLSANRHPIIPSCQQSSQMSGSVLENIYRPMVTSANTPSDSSIEALTNTNRAHTYSLRDSAPLDVSLPSNGHHIDYPIFEDKVLCEVCSQMIEPSKLNLHKTMHIFTDGKDQQSPSNNTSKSGQEPSLNKQTFNKPRTYRCVVCQIGFRVMGHLSKHHKSKSHLQGLVNSGLLSKSLNAKIEESKVPIAEVIDQKTGNIIPGVLSKYLSNWSQAPADCDFT